LNRFVISRRRRLLGALVPAVVLAFAAVPALAQQQPKKAPAAAKAALAKKTVAKKAPVKTTGTKTTGASGQAFLIGTFGDWKALTTGKDKQKVCYALAQPNQRLPAKLKRDPGYLFISNRTGDGAKGEIAFKMGFAPKAGQEDQLVIGTTTFVVIGTGESVFLKNPAQEAQVIDLMKKAATVTIKVTSARGNETTDRYSMNGLTKALEAVGKECP
jgi:invasion protein IalB